MSLFANGPSLQNCSATLWCPKVSDHESRLFKTIEGLPIPNPLGIYYRDSDSTLVRLEHEFTTIKPNKSQHLLTRRCLVNRIVLSDFDSKYNYGISLNGNQITVSAFSHEDACQVIDFSTLDPQSRTIIENAVGEDEPPIPKHRRHLYLNFDRISKILLHAPQLVNPIQHLILEGFFKINGNWTECHQTVAVFPYTTYYLPLSHPTHSICISSGSPEQKESPKGLRPKGFQLWIGGTIYGEFKMDEEIIFNRTACNKPYLGFTESDIPPGVEALNFTNVSSYITILPEEGSLDNTISIHQKLYKIYFFDATTSQVCLRHSV